MRKVLVPALLTGLALAACGDDTSGTGGGGEGGEGASSTTTTTTTTTTTSSGGGEGGGTEAVCGDGNVGMGEACDDGNTTAGDGCSASCAIESGYECAGEPSVCATDCGDGVIAGAEACDDGNQVADDGCSLTCTVETGFDCTGTPSVCASTCGDSVIAADEGCDDGNTTADDGCSASCDIDAGWACTGTPSVCTTSCGDGVPAGAEACDDGNMADGDGCSMACAVETGFDCTGTPSVCTAVCGDGMLAGTEECDDGNTDGGDCCSAMCEIEAGCEIEPNNTIATANDFMALQVNGRVNGFVDPAGDVNYYMFTLTTPGDLIAETFDGILGTTCSTNDVDTRIRIFDGVSATPLVTNDDGGAGYCSLAVATNLAAGTYYVAVDASTLVDPLANTFDYALGITVDSYVCGDGDLDPGEGCDDGDMMAGDGCSDTCQVESGYSCSGQPSVCELDVSANTCDLAPVVGSGTYLGSTATASGKTNSYGPYTCSISGSGGGAGNDGVYAINVPAGSILNASVVGTGFDAVLVSATTCPGINGSCLIRRDASGSGGTESLSYTNATAGAQTIFVVVDAFTAGTGGSFALTLDVVTPVCGNGVVEPGEQCDDGGTMSGNGCSATCQVELGYTCTGAPSACTTVLPGCMDQFVVVPATGTPAAIPDNQPAGGAVLTFNVANTGTVTGLAMGFSATHTYTGDVRIYLSGPAAVERNVCLNRGGGGDNFNGTVFRDGGAALSTASAPFAGVYAPEQAFSFFNTQTVTGTWTARVADSAGGDTGTVTQAYLAFCIAP